MSFRKWFPVIVFVLSALIAFIATTYFSGDESSQDQNVEADVEEQVVDTAKISALLAEAEAIIYGQSGPPMIGIQKYKEVLTLDSNNIEAIYQLGVLSIRSNQMEKAAERFKKLILLRPENEEYKETYQDILAALEAE